MVIFILRSYPGIFFNAIALKHSGIVSFLFDILCIITSVCGISSGFAYAYDVFRFCTAGINLVRYSVSNSDYFIRNILHAITYYPSQIYFIFALLYASHIHLLGSMWLLFQGKKRNVFRHRIDTLDYDASQMMFGTLLFIITIFVLPNIAIYSIFFTAVRLSQLFIEAVLVAGYEHHWSLILTCLWLSYTTKLLKHDIAYSIV